MSAGAIGARPGMDVPAVLLVAQAKLLVERAAGAIPSERIAADLDGIAAHLSVVVAKIEAGAKREGGPQ